MYRRIQHQEAATPAVLWLLIFGFVTLIVIVHQGATPLAQAQPHISTLNNTHATSSSAISKSTSFNGAACAVTYRITSEWRDWFSTEVTITNNSGADLEEWTLTWAFPGNQEIVLLWNGTYTQDDNQVVVNNAFWNGSVPDGETVRFGFTASYNGTNDAPTDFTLNEMPCNSDAPSPTPTITPGSESTATPTLGVPTPTPTATGNITPTPTPMGNALAIGFVLPFQGRNDLDNEINIYGHHFEAEATVSIDFDPEVTSLSTTFINRHHLRAVVPAGQNPALVDIIVTNPDGEQATLSNAYTILDPNAHDLFGYEHELWTVPTSLKAGDSSLIGLVVHRQGGSAILTDFIVSFYLGDPDAGGTLIGDSHIFFLAPNRSFTTIPVSWRVPSAGEHTIYAIIDSDNDVQEDNEDNNVVIRTVTVQSTGTDVTAPTVDDFTINDGAIETSNQEVELRINASDPPPSESGLESVFIIEYEFNEVTKLWVPAQSSGWEPYSSTILWTLLPSAGVKYLQVWVSDEAGNISSVSRGASINYLPGTDTLRKGASRFYLYDLNADQNMTVTLTPISGDPDLYVWSPSGNEAWNSINDGNEVDEVSFTAPTDGTIIVQVYGYEAAEYSLSTTIDTAKGRTTSSNTTRTLQGKIPLSQAGLAVTDLPERLMYALPSAPTTEYEIYLPLILY